jgi:hypothetical protein
MDELTLDGKIYLSSKKSADITGYAKDYIGQLCREGRVEARLVGRNWYVLEKSIREHRFGPEEKIETPAVVENSIKIENEPAPYSWVEPKYRLENTAKIDLDDKSTPIPSGTPLIGAVEEPTSPPYTSPVLQEMQSAWHDWFNREGQGVVSKEILLENVLETEISSHVEDQDESISVPIHKITAESIQTPLPRSGTFQNIQPVSTYAAPLPVSKQPVDMPFEIQEEVRHKDEALTRWETEKTNRKLQGDTFKARIAKRKSSMVLKVLLLLIAALSASIALIGTGKVETYIPTKVASYSVFKLIAGESTLEKVYK